MLWLDFDSQLRDASPPKAGCFSPATLHTIIKCYQSSASYHTYILLLYCIVLYEYCIVVSSTIRRRKPRMHCERREAQETSLEYFGEALWGKFSTPVSLPSLPLSQTRANFLGRTSDRPHWIHSPSSYYRACSWTPKTSPNDVTFQTAHWFW